MSLLENTQYIDSASVLVLNANKLTASGSLSGTASWSNNAQTASYISNVVSSSYALTSSAATSITFVPNLSNTSSYVTMAQSASYISSSNILGTITNNISSSIITASNVFVVSNLNVGNIVNTGQNIMVNSGFDTGNFTGWNTSYALTSSNSQSGSYACKLDSITSGNQYSYITQSVTVPTNGLLTFYLNGISSTYSTTYFTVVFGSTQLFGITASSIPKTYTQYSVNMFPYSGQTNNLIFKMNDSAISGDDVIIDSINLSTYNSASIGNIFVNGNITASNFIGTASYATLANTASYVLNAVSSSAATSITFIPNLSNTASCVYNATTASINSGGKLVQMNDINFYSNWQEWYGSHLGSWIQLSSAGPSGIGASGPGQSPWVALASQNGFWFTTAIAGDIAYRNTSGRLLFGTNGNTGPNMYIDTASNNGNIIISSKTGMGGVTSPVNTLDVAGNISCSVITASLHLGTASYATLANTASYVTTSQTASYVLNAISSSAATSITFTPTLANTASYVTTSQTASYVLNAVSSSYVSSSNSTINTLNTTFLNSTGTLSVSSSTNIVNVNDCIITSKWFNGNTGTWIQLSAAGPSGIGSSAPGSAPWIALASGNGYWFTDAVTNDIAYRNTSGRLLFGTSAGNANFYIDTNGNSIAKQKVGIGGVTSPVNSLDVTGNILCTTLTGSVVGSSINQMPYSSSAHALTPLAVAGSSYFRYGTPNLLFTYTGTSWISSSMSN
jgi:hypothetical protein